MIQVTKAEFFAVMNPQDVHPCIVSKWDRENGYTCDWQLRDRRSVGKSYSGTTLQESRYFLPNS